LTFIETPYVPEPTLEEPTQRLFVYGTLRRGNGNDRLLITGGATFIEEVWLYGHAMYGILSVNVANPEDRVRGEIWEVPTRVLLGPIDRLENHPWGWCRTWVPNQYNGIWVYLDRYYHPQCKRKDGDINREWARETTISYEDWCGLWD